MASQGYRNWVNSPLLGHYSLGIGLCDEALRNWSVWLAFDIPVTNSGVFHSK